MSTRNRTITICRRRRASRILWAACAQPAFRCMYMCTYKHMRVHMYVCMSASVCARVHPHPPTSSTHLHPCRSPECRHIRLYMSVSYVDLARICTLAVVLSSLLSGICTVAVVLGLFCFTKTALYHASDIVVNIIICTLAVVLGRALPHHSGRLGSYPRPRPALPALLVHA